MRRKISELKKGFGALEVILAAAVLTIIISSGSALISQAMRISQEAQRNSQAAMLAQEGIEAALSIQKNDYDELIAGVHGISVSGGRWILSGSSDQPFGEYTRELLISDADDDRKDISVRVSWQSSSGLKYVQLYTRLTDFRKEDEWVEPTVASYLDIIGNDDGKAIYEENKIVYLLTAGHNGPDFFLIDVSDSADPFLIKDVDIGKKAEDIFVDFPIAYLATGNQTSEIQAFNVSNPANPIALGSLDLPGNKDARGIYVSSALAYVVTDRNSSNEEFFVVDVSSPAAMSIIGKLELNAKANKVFIKNNYAYVVTDDNSKELIIIDIANPTSPALVTNFDLLGRANANDIKIAGDYAYVVTQANSIGGEFYIIDVSDVFFPSVISSYELDASANSVSIKPGEYAFVGNRLSGRKFLVIDITDQLNPTYHGYLDIDEGVVDVYYDNDTVYIATRDNEKEFGILKAKE